MDSCSPSREIIQRVAQREDVDSTELPPLYETLDPSALDTLVQTEATISFEYAGHHITVEGGDPAAVTIRSAHHAESAGPSAGRSTGTTD